jgi:hypothetical protein
VCKILQTISSLDDAGRLQKFADLFFAEVLPGRLPWDILYAFTRSRTGPLGEKYHAMDRTRF